MWGSLFLGCVFAIGDLHCIETTRKRGQALTERNDVPLLFVDDVAQLVRGALQKGHLRFQSFDDVFVHGRDLGSGTRGYRAWASGCMAKLRREEQSAEFPAYLKT
jgi:hypothetical protein